MALGRHYSDKHAIALQFIQRNLPDFVDDDIDWTSVSTPWQNDDKEKVYHCFGFVLDSRSWWQPSTIAGDSEGDPRYYWPKNLRDPGPWVANYVAAAQMEGFEECGDSMWEDDFERIALLHMRGVFVHAALQVSSNRWKSKLGELSDFEHSLKAILDVYPGHRTTFMRRFRRERRLK